MIGTIVSRLTLEGVNGMLRTRATRALRAVATLFVAAAIVGNPSPAAAVVAPGTPTVTITPADALAVATYQISRFRVPNGETVTGYTLTFPAGTDATGATSPGNTVTVGGDSRTVTVTFGAPIVGPQNNVTLTIGNVRNPGVPGTYSITQVIFRVNNTNQTVNLGTDGTYTIGAAAFLSMTITTPDDGQSVEFGAIDPDVTTGTRVVVLAVTSSAQYTISRSVVGGAALGLDVSGVPVGVLQPAAAATPATFTDTYRLRPPWDTSPEVLLTATVQYTVTQ